LKSNIESGEGRCDIMLTPIRSEKEKSGVIIELKVGGKDKLKIRSREALKQIEEKKYYKDFEGQGIDRED